MSRKIKNIADALISLIFPRRCPVCDKPVKPYGSLICADCVSKIRYVGSDCCYKCGKPLDDPNEEYCADCRRGRHFFTKGISVFEYKSVSDSIYRFKYKNRREYADFFGICMSQKLGECIRGWRPDALVPVPIHPSKMKTRGYNQAALLAKALSEHIGVPVMENAVRRVKKTAPLKDLSPTERNNILRGAFKLHSDVVKLKTIVLIDDIYTTGATTDEIARLLKEAGVENVYCATLAIGRGM